MNKTDRRQLALYLLRRKVGAFFANLLIMLILIGLCFVILQPLFNKISMSFMSEEDLYDSSIIAIPRHPTLVNYKVAWEAMDFGKSAGSTFLISLTVALLQVISTLLVGYGFARFEFPLKKLIFGLVILLIVVPPQTYSSGLYLHFRFFDIFNLFKSSTGHTLNLIGTPISLFLLAATATGLKCGIYIFLFRQYFRNIPKDIEEAAFVDGCGTFKTLFLIMLPDAMPLATSVFLFSFVWQWMDDYLASLLMRSSNILAIRLSNVAQSTGFILSQKGIVLSGGGSEAFMLGLYSLCVEATATLMVLIPVLVLYFFAQKRFVESLSSSGIKM